MSAWSWSQAPEARKLSLPAAVAIHAQVQLARTLRLRTLWPWLAVTLAVTLGGWAIVHFSVESAERFSDYVDTWAIRAIALVALGLGTAAVRQDAEAGALSFFLLRPQAKLALPIGRWLAASAVSGVLGEVSVLMLWLVTRGTSAEMPFTDLLALLLAAGLAAMAYSATFIAIAIWFRAAVGMSVGWLVLLDSLATQSASFAAIAPSHYLGRILGEESPPETTAVTAVAALLGWTVLMLVASATRLQREPPVSGRE